MNQNDTLMTDVAENKLAIPPLCSAGKKTKNAKKETKTKKKSPATTPKSNSSTGSRKSRNTQQELASLQPDLDLLKENFDIEVIDDDYFLVSQDKLPTGDRNIESMLDQTLINDNEDLFPQVVLYKKKISLNKFYTEFKRICNQPKFQQLIKSQIFNKDKCVDAKQICQQLQVLMNITV